MGKLIYSATMSLDGYIEDTSGNFDWATPDEEVHAFANEMERQVSTHLYGRRMYETMRVWERIEELPDVAPAMLEYAPIWRSLEKVVYSRTLPEVTTERTRLEREFDPDKVRELKAQSEGDVSIGGANLAAHAIRDGLVDEFAVFIAPAVVGGGNAFFPKDVRIDLRLTDERRFGNGMVFLRYEVAG